MTQVRNIVPMDLPGATVRPVTGTKPELIWVNPTSLMVDAIYQRDLSERSMRLIRKMVEGFNWNRMKPPIVVRVGCDLHIVDGQHTAIVAATLRVPEIPVFIVSADTVDERARAFVGHNTDRVIVSPFDIYRALVSSGDPDALDVANVCKRAGIRVRYISPSSAIEVGDTSSIGTIKKIVARRGVIKARQVLEALVAAKRAPVGTADILAAEAIICVEQIGVDLTRLARVIRVDGTAGMAAAYAKAKIERVPVWRTLLQRWLAGLRGGL